MEKQMYAIIGIGLRFPGGNNSPDVFYENIKNKRDCLKEIPKDRWNKEHYYHPDKKHPGTMVTKRCGFLTPYFEFDNESFQMSVKEAMSLDPSTKILLETALETLEDANVKYMGTKTGVFIGTGQQGYAKYATVNPEQTSQYSATGTEIGIQSNMLSYKFDLRGPSMIVDTACSSAGTALYNALNSFKNGDCEMALVGGFNNLLNYGMTVCFSRLGVLSPDGRCKSFDEAANGYVRSEGAGFILVKPLDKAISDENHIYSIIRTCAANIDGALEPSLTKPSVDAQEKLFKETLKRANVDPSDVFYVEAHATGTQVGDPAECKTIGTVCNSGKKRDLDCKIRVGSIKANIGHCEMASFMASIIKSSIMLDRNVLLPTPVNKINPKLNMDKYNMIVQQDVEKMDLTGKIFVVNSFGFGGANACCVLQGYKNEEKIVGESKLEKPYIYLCTSRTTDSLNKRIEQYKEFSKTIDDQKSLAYTLNTRVMEGNKFLSYGIGDTLHDAQFSNAMRFPDEKPIVCTVFSGQGPQHLQMGRELYKTIPAFKQAIDKCDELYKEISGKSILYDVGLYGEKECTAEVLKDIEVTLPALMFMQVGLWETWKKLGLKVDLIIGHSFGEMTALYACGAITMKKCLQICYARGKICKTLDNQGKMIAIGTSVDEVMKIIEEHKLEKIWVAAENSKVSCSFGGIHESIYKLDKICTEKKIFHAILSITNAFHTPLLEPMKKAAFELFPKLDSAFPMTDIISTVTGDVWDTPFSKKYLWRNISEKVNFKKAIDLARNRSSNTLFLELAPHPVLSMSLKQCGAKNVIPSITKTSEKKVFLNAIGKLVGNKVELDWKEIIGDLKEIRNLPRYPFQRVNCFQNIECVDRVRLAKEITPENRKYLLGRKVDCTGECYRNTINVEKYNFLGSHVVKQSIVFPAAAYIEQFLEINGGYLNNIQILNPLVIPEKDKFVITECKEAGNGVLNIHSRTEFSDNWLLNAKAEKSYPLESVEVVSKLNLEEIKSRCKKVVNKKEVYGKLDLKDLTYGKYFQLIENANVGDDEIIAEIDPSILIEEYGYDFYVLHPSVLDACFQLVELTLKEIKTYLPTKINRLEVRERINISESKKIMMYCEVKDFIEYEKIVGDIIVTDTDGKVLVVVKELEMTYVSVGRQKNKENLKEIMMKKSFDLDFKIKEKKDVENHGLLEQFSNLKNKILNGILKHMPRLRKLASPSEKHAFLNWIESQLLEKKDLDEKEFTEEFVKQYGNFVKLSDIITKYFAPIVRNKPKTEEDARKEIVEKIFEELDSYKEIKKFLDQIFNEICRTKNRVVRILELHKDTGFVCTKNYLQNLKDNLDGMIEVKISSGHHADNLKEEFGFVENIEVNPYEEIDEKVILPNSIDLVFVNGLNINKKLCENVKKLLVKNGKLVIIQNKEEFQFIENFVFGAVVKSNQEHYKKIIKPEFTKLEEAFKEFEKNGFSNVVNCDCNEKIFTIYQKEKEIAKESKESVDFIDTEDIFELLEAIKSHKKNNPLLVVTKGVFLDYQLEYAAHVGLIRVAQNEFPDWKLKMIDFSKKLSEEKVNEWKNYFKKNIDVIENENCVDENGELYVNRCVPFPKEKEEKETKVEKKQKELICKLEIGQKGILDTLHYGKFDKRPLSKNEVFCKVHYSTLNFKDLMMAQGMLNKLDPVMSLGLEFSGVILEVGSEVKEFKVGDKVFGFCDDSLSTHVYTTELLIQKVPEGMSMEEAASISTIFVTPYYALVKKSNIGKNDNVLIHSAAGGVGQAAIQICQNFGANPCCTVGGQSKRDFLKKRYSVNCFGNSRKKDWDVEVLKTLKDQKKENEGIDCVLNSLSGENIMRGIKVLKPFGSFIEIGKRDILANNAMNLLPFLENLSYYSVHIDKIIKKRPELIHILLKEVGDMYTKNNFKSVIDVNGMYDWKNIIKAFRYMQSGAHRGKIVINFTNSNEGEAGDLVKGEKGCVRNDRAYILSGGLGVIGFKLAQFLVREGARHIVLLSRSGKLKKNHERVIEKLGEQGIKFYVMKADVCDNESISRMYCKVRDIDGVKIGGIIHMATVYNDSMIMDQSKEKFGSVYSPKVNGAQNLINSLSDSEKKNLEFAIFFSSISAVMGNLEQSNYSSGNSFLDTYAKYLRKYENINAKSINLGAVVDAGLIAEDLTLRKIMEMGLLDILNDGMGIEQVFGSIKMMILGKEQQYIPVVGFKKIIDAYPTSYGVLKFSHLVDKNLEISGGNSGSTDGSEITIEAVLEIVSKCIDKEVSTIDVDAKLTDFGVDSLTAMEISMIVKEKFGSVVTQMEILGGGLSTKELFVACKKNKK